ncbi:MAG: hydroxymethylglutaryl-CoA reductase [Candidatus Kapaibacterium sp.]
MATSSDTAKRTIGRLLESGSLNQLVERIRPVMPEERPLPPPPPDPRNWSRESAEGRKAFVRNAVGDQLPYLTGSEEIDDPSELKGNIEQFIGMTQIPTGLIGPLRINGTMAHGDFYVPLATTEGALVASYHRGASLISRCGGATTVCLTEVVQRSPCFRFENFAQAGSFLIWVMTHQEEIIKIVPQHSNHAKLEEIKPNVDGNQITLLLEFSTGDAAGQNMVTICTDAICTWILETCPVSPTFWFVEGNLSGDKKATALSFLSVRGKKVTSEVLVPRELVERILRTSPEAMFNYWKTSILNGVQSGSIGVNGHFANGLAAIFLACGQDVACVAEASVGTTRFDITESGDLYACVTLPSLIVGTVGGGTRLPTQREALRILGCEGNGTARKFAEICAATVLCGELSIVGAIAAGDFAKAHALYGRRKKSSE